MKYLNAAFTALFLLFSGISAYEMPPLPYGYESLEPHMSSALVHIHYDKHHRAYLDNLNSALLAYPELAARDAQDLVMHWKEMPNALQIPIRNFGGGFINHTFFWKSMAPVASFKEPTGALLAALNKTFGGFDSFKKQFEGTAIKLFGSGWVWLCLNPESELAITTTSNQDTPLSDGLVPLLTLDVWEHAYYLQYQNKRPAFIQAWWNIVNWPMVEKRYAEAVEKIKISRAATIIIPGISGDLAKRKLIPALYQHFKKGFNGLIIGTGRKDADVSALLEDAKPFIQKLDHKVMDRMMKSFVYHKLDPDKAESYAALLKDIKTIEAEKGIINHRIVYLSVPSETFMHFTKGFVESGIIVPGQKQNIIAYEKPVGNDVKSARAITAGIKALLPEPQIFFIDHYSARELLAHLGDVVKMNPLLQTSWNNKVVESVQIAMEETLGVEGRGSFYEHYGALKDVLQNHMLQMLAQTALATMQSPAKLEDAHKQRSAFIRSVRIGDAVFGQYEGYTQEKDVAADSKVDTFAEVKLYIDTPQWQGVPFILKTGKKLARKASLIELRLKATKNNPQQTVTIELAPQETIKFSLNVPFGQQQQITLSSGNLVSKDAYEHVFESLIRGEHDRDVSVDEINAQWELVDRIGKKNKKLIVYKPGSDGLETIH